jgi:carbonic anhydrase
VQLFQQPRRFGSLTASADRRVPNLGRLMTRNLALDILIAGNERWAQGTPFPSVVRASPQAPLAALLCCSELGPEPEEIFGRPPGSLFVYQGAGTLVSTSAGDAIAYAVQQLGVKLVITMAHNHCELVATHPPGVTGLDTKGPPGLSQAMWAATYAARRLAQREDLAPAITAGEVHVVPVVFDEDSARVSVVHTH